MKIHELFQQSKKYIIERKVNKTHFEQILADPTIQFGFECEMIISYYNDENRSFIYVDDMAWSDIKKYFKYNTSEIGSAFEDWNLKKLDEQWQQEKDEYTLNWIKRNRPVAYQELMNKQENQDEDYKEFEYDLIEEFEDYAGDTWYDNHKNDYDYNDYISSSFSSILSFIHEFEITPKYGWKDNNNIYIENNNELFGHEFAANSLSQYLKEKVEVLRGHNQTTKEFDIWYIEPDSSITNDDDTDISNGVPAEIVSPVFSSLNEGLKNMQKIFLWMNANSHYTNTSTGLHVTLSIKGKTGENYDFLKMIVFFDENYTANLFGRLNNTFTEQMRSKLKRIIDKNPDEHPLISLFNDEITSRGSLKEITWLLKRIGTTLFQNFAKYYSIRSRGNGSFEFRGMGGTNYQDKFPEIRKQIISMANVLKISSNDKLYAKEYISKIFALLEGKYKSAQLGSGKKSVNIPKDLMFLSDILKKNPRLAKIADDGFKNEFIYELGKLARNYDISLTKIQELQLARYIAANKIKYNRDTAKALGSKLPSPGLEKTNYDY